MLFKYQEISHEEAGPGSAVAVLVSGRVMWRCLVGDDCDRVAGDWHGLLLGRLAQACSHLGCWLHSEEGGGCGRSCKVPEGPDPDLQDIPLLPVGQSKSQLTRIQTVGTLVLLVGGVGATFAATQRSSLKG